MRYGNSYIGGRNDFKTQGAWTKPSYGNDPLAPIAGRDDDYMMMEDDDIVIDDLEETDEDVVMNDEFEELLNNIESKISQKKGSSAWDMGVAEYAFEILGELRTVATSSDVTIDVPSSKKEFEELLLNGATNWKTYSESGCSLVSDSEIAERLCTPSALKQCKGGARPPHEGSSWIEVQATALYQAAGLILDNSGLD